MSMNFEFRVPNFAGYERGATLQRNGKSGKVSRGFPPGRTMSHRPGIMHAIIMLPMLPMLSFEPKGQGPRPVAQGLESVLEFGVE